MRASLRALLSGVIDYAGLFPPAKLPLEAAFRNFIRYQESADRWLLGRFICPAGQLSELARLLPPDKSSAHMIPLSILGRGGDDGAAFFANLHQDVACIADFRSRNNHARVDSLEIRFPSHLLTVSPGEQQEFLQRVSSTLGPKLQALPVAFEPVLVGDWRHSLPAFLSTLQQHGAAWGLKLRCGGLVREAFPTVDQVAYILHTCRLTRTTLKFTAGLHHPFRHEARLRPEDRAEVAIRMHGFVNIFVAGVLGYARKIGESELQAIIADEDAAHFSFDDSGLHWREFGATLDEIAAARRLVTSFGSCSFDEPLDDLQRI